MEKNTKLIIGAIAAVIVIILLKQAGLMAVLTTPSYSDTGLEPATTYYYKISAENEYGESPLSDYVSVTTLTEAPELVCGDGVVEGIEECDGSNLAGETCILKGFDGGILTCTECILNTQECWLGECNINEDCETGFECVDNVCMELPECTIDDDCDSGYECKDNICIAEEAQPVAAGGGGGGGGGSWYSPTEEEPEVSEEPIVYKKTLIDRWKDIPLNIRIIILLGLGYLGYAYYNAEGIFRKRKRWW